MSEDILFVKMRLPWILEIFVMTSRQEVDSIYYSQFKKADYQVITPIACKGTQKKYKFSVIVPFRENPYQNRSQQLKKFIPYMTEYLSQLGENYQFSIIIVEQSADGRKFNRGQLLNIGFQIGRSQGCDYHIFHDVDLLPDQDLLCYYGFCPISPLHLAAHWEKYQFLDLFFGGVCSFVTEQFQKVNGYPNNFWGWGGEDEEIYHRVVASNLIILKPEVGGFIELPHIHSKKIPDLVNEARFDLIKKNIDRKDNGLSNLDMTKVVLLEKINQYTDKYLAIL